MKICGICNISKDRSEFCWKDKSKDLKEHRCKSCRADTYQKNKVAIRLKANETHRENKRKAVKAKGGVCSRCGEMPHISAMEFHHVDPSKKSFTIAQYAFCTWETVSKELEKCVMLCANCHRIVHAEMKEEEYGTPQKTLLR